MEGLRRWWRRFDWNWRAFGWQEWFCLVSLPFWLAYLVSGIARRDWNMAVLGALETPVSIHLFSMSNHQRRNPRPRQPELDPADRPLRLTLGLGFLVLVAVLVLIVSFAR